MLKGQAKTDYQRDYMRKRRMGLTGSNAQAAMGSNKRSNIVSGRVKMGYEPTPQRPNLDADGNPIPD